METILGDINLIIQHNPWLAPLAVFLGGALTASNPCVLAMIPLMMAFVGAYQETSNVPKAFSFSFLFVIGLTITFTLLGFIAALMGRLIGDVGRFWPYLVTLVCLIMGLHLLGVWNFDLPLPQGWKPSQARSFLARLPFRCCLHSLCYPNPGCPAHLHRLPRKFNLRRLSSLHVCLGTLYIDFNCRNFNGLGQENHRVQRSEHDLEFFT